jgi:hypothetical protein
VQPNIRVAEQLETQRMMNAGQQQMDQDAVVSDEMQGEQELMQQQQQQIS